MSTHRTRQSRDTSRGTPEHRPLHGQRFYRACKAAGDRAVSLVLLILVAPLLAVLALLVRASSTGPVIYSQIRLGKGGREYRVFKLRTMYHDCEAATGAVWAVQDDPRSTPVGRFLRDTHLDELPQLWNVLRGEMSLIGPRPERPEIATELERGLPAYRHRLQARPGLTGLAQLRLSADINVDGVRRKLAHDLYYVRRLGPIIDLQLGLATVLYLAARVAKSSADLIIRAHGKRAERELSITTQASAPMPQRDGLQLELHLGGPSRRAAKPVDDEVKAA
jgi:lipopolysaccharide/colanic/teichoic acid biosynthesis glycosyltransferase